MSTLQEAVKLFNEELTEEELPDSPVEWIGPILDKLLKQADMISSEVNELCASIGAENPVLCIDAATDILYLTLHLFNQLGVPLDPFFWEVHRSNMTKNGGVVDGKLQKGDAYEPPNIVGIYQSLIEDRKRQDGA